MKEGLSILADLATVATFIVALFTLEKVKKIEVRTRVDIDQSSNKGTSSRTEVRQDIKGSRNIQIGRDMNE